jgi:hypothetical protein
VGAGRRRPRLRDALRTPGTAQDDRQGIASLASADPRLC